MRDQRCNTHDRNIDFGFHQSVESNKLFGGSSIFHDVFGCCSNVEIDRGNPAVLVSDWMTDTSLVLFAYFGCRNHLNFSFLFSYENRIVKVDFFVLTRPIPNRAMPRRTVPNLTGPAMPCRAKPYHARPDLALPCRAEPDRAETRLPRLDIPGRTLPNRTLTTPSHAHTRPSLACPALPNPT